MKSIIYSKDALAYVCITTLSPDKLKSEPLEIYVDKKDFKTAPKMGDVVYTSPNGPYSYFVDNYENLSLENRYHNLKWSYFHFLDSCNVFSKTFAKITQAIDGIPFYDVYIFYTCVTILKSATSLFINNDNILNKEAKKQITSMRKDAFQVLGIEFDQWYGINQAIINGVVPNMRKILNLPNLSTKALLDLVHRNNLDYLSKKGAEVYDLLDNNFKQR